MSKIMPPPQIIVKGGQDMDGTWGVTKTFTREFYFELINVPLPLFMMSSYIPAYNSLHPYYPWAIAKDSKCTKNIELNLGGGNTGRGVTISTNYQILKPAVPLDVANTGSWVINNIINANMPWFLPAQDVTSEPVTVEETLDYLWVQNDEEWEEVPFRTSAGTKLTGATTRNILKISFWYLADPTWFDASFAVAEYTGAVNDDDCWIAGYPCPTGTAKIESIEMMDSTWERAEVAHVSLKMVKVVILIDYKTWFKQYENVSNLFMAYPYIWEKAKSGEKENTVMSWDTKYSQPMYRTKVKNVSPQRIFCTMYDPEPKNEGDDDEPIWVSDPLNAIQFFGTREDCFRLNPDSEPTEVSEPMYLDMNGFVLYPDPETGKVDTALSPKVEGYISMPMDFTPLRFPVK